MKVLNPEEIKSLMSQLGRLGMQKLREQTTEEQRKEWCARGGRNRKGWRKKKPGLDGGEAAVS